MIMDVTANILLLRHLVSIHYILGKGFAGITPSAFASVVLVNTTETSFDKTDSRAAS